MTLHLNLGKQTWKVLAPALDISIPLRFGGPQPNTYGVPRASSHPYEGQGFIGDVKQGGSCNFDSYTFIAHCNGTHTEGLGHLSPEDIYIHEILNESHFPASLISLPLRQGGGSKDSYQPPLEEEDWYVGVDDLENALESCHPDFLRALVIRTLPNDASKQSRDYMNAPCPFLSNEAMALISSKEIEHLLVDFPSVDRLMDDGKLSNHRIYWGYDGKKADFPQKTITEMVYVPDEVKDGKYLLEIQLAAFMSDASPSRPRLFELEEGGQ